MATADAPFVDQLKRLKPHVDSWTLAQDTALAKALHDFSLKLDDRTQSVAAAVDSFGLRLTRAQVRLSNAANELSTLSRTQFLEHRVYDEEAPTEEDESAERTNGGAEPERSEAAQQEALVRECSAFAQLGIKAIAAYPMTEPEDVPPAADIAATSYLDLPLPFVIGTPEFLANDTCGLFEPDERDTMRTTMETGAAGEEEEDDDDDDDDADAGDDDDEEVDADDDEAALAGIAEDDEDEDDEDDEDDSEDDEDDEGDSLVRAARTAPARQRGLRASRALPSRGCCHRVACTPGAAACLAGSRGLSPLAIRPARCRAGVPSHPALTRARARSPRSSPLAIARGRRRTHG